MYKLVLCWRYLLTRYLALVCIVSVMLGVATLIVVNSVMSGFSTKLKDRLHGLLSDVDIERSGSFYGIDSPEEKMERIRRDPFLNERIEAMTPTMETLGLLQFDIGNETMLKPARLLGVNARDRASLGGFDPVCDFRALRIAAGAKAAAGVADQGGHVEFGDVSFHVSGKGRNHSGASHGKGFCAKRRTPFP